MAGSSSLPEGPTDDWLWRLSSAACRSTLVLLGRPCQGSSCLAALRAGGSGWRGRAAAPAAGINPAPGSLHCSAGSARLEGTRSETSPGAFYNQSCLLGCFLANWFHHLPGPVLCVAGLASAESVWPFDLGVLGHFWSTGGDESVSSREP